MSAVIHQMVMRKRAVAAQAKRDELARDEIIAQAKGEPGVVWRGPWDRNTAYVVGDAVGHKGSSYIAIEDSKEQRPPSKSWDTLTEKGKDGKAGAEGKSGVVSLGAGRFDLDTLPVGDVGIAPQAVALKQNGVWVQMPWVDFLSLVGSPLPEGTTTVNGEVITVDGDYVTVT